MKAFSAGFVILFLLNVGIDCVSKRGCSDQNQHCGYWAGVGECRNFPEWMDENCAKSCEKCSAPTPTPAPTPASGGCKCGIPQVSRNRIVGGKPAEEHEFPWLVAIFRWGDKPFCGGTLLSSRTVLTAAHCGVSSQDTVYVGEHDVTKADGEQKIGISRVTNHPSYGDFDNDFAIIYLAEEVTFTSKIMPVCLPSAGKNYDDVVATTAGWGDLQDGGYNPDIPHEVDVNTMTNIDCTRTSYQKGDITSNMICAANSGKDSCQGDSGGPLMTNEGNFFSLIGVVSWGEGCAKPEYPGVYARVTQQLGWIEEQIRGNKCPKP